MGIHRLAVPVPGSVKNAASRKEHIALSSKLPPPMGKGLHALPENAREAVRFITERDVGRVEEHWGEQRDKLQTRAELLTPELPAAREELKVGS